MSNNEINTSIATNTYPAGVMLFEEGDPGSRMYVIRKGSVRIFRKGNDSELLLAILETGEFFGEMALLENLPRSACAETVEECELIEVDSQTFENMIRNNSEITLRIMQRLAGRVRELDLRLQNLLLDSGLGRAVEILRWLLPHGHLVDGWVELPAATVHISLGTQAGVAPDEINHILARLREVQCIREVGSNIYIAKREILDAFVKYMDLKRRYEPGVQHTDKDQKDQSAPPNRQLHHLLRALNIPLKNADEHSQTLSRSYQQYLKLRRQFEHH